MAYDRIAGPLTGPVYGEDAILRAEIDLDQIVRGRYDLDVVGHYARPDVFRLHVDERARPTVVADGDDEADA